MKPISVVALAVMLSACVPAAPAYLTAPSDPSLGVRPARYARVTAGIRNYDVVEPLDWRELNRRVAPGVEPERGDSDDAARRGR
jgi:hypothetical protein